MRNTPVLKPEKDSGQKMTFLGEERKTQQLEREPMVFKFRIFQKMKNHYHSDGGLKTVFENTLQ